MRGPRGASTSRRSAGCSMSSLAPNKRPGYIIPPKVAAAVSLSRAEANALGSLLSRLMARGEVPAGEVRTAAAVLARAKKSLARAKKARADFDGR